MKSEASTSTQSTFFSREKLTQTLHQDHKDRYSSIEHKAIGDIAFDEFIQKYRNDPDINVLKNRKLLQAKNIFQLSTHISLSPGDIIALAGDFYGAPNEVPICFSSNATKTFTEAYESLVSADPSEIKKFLQGIEEEREMVMKALQNGIQPSIELNKKGHIPELLWNGLLTKRTTVSLNFLDSRYVRLLAHNFDHFFNEARKAYRIGHEVAIATAKRGGTEDDPKLLAKAFAQELFACHFLTDLFAAGHIRTPRKEIYDFVKQSGFPEAVTLGVAGLLANAMHDEDNINGVKVRSDKHPDGWDSYGDNCYFDSNNVENALFARNAVVASLENIYQAFLHPEIDATYHNYESHFPKTSDADNLNRPPLLKVEKNGATLVLKVRKDETTQNDEPYESVTNPIWLAIQLKARGIKKHVQNDENLTGDEKNAWLAELEKLTSQREILIQAQKRALEVDEEVELHPGQTSICLMM